MNFYNRYARGGSFGRKENAGSEFISPSSPAGLFIMPYVQDGQTLFLKTISPSRKETKRYSNEDTES